MATSQSQTKPTQIDHLSSLPDAVLLSILSLLPTHVAARTSVLSRRFQHLWKASPVVDLFFYLPSFKSEAEALALVAYGALLNRKPCNPLLRLDIHVGHSISRDLPRSFIPSLLSHAHSLRLRHLTLEGKGHGLYLQLIVCSVFSISSLQSLSFSLNTFSGILLPSATSLTHLKSLSIRPRVHSAQVERLLLELCCLDHLQLSHVSLTPAAMVNLSSLTVKKLELLALSCFEGRTCSLGLFMPSLEFLYLSKGYNRHLPHIYGDIPLLRKSVITLDYLIPVHVTAVAQLLNCISHMWKS
ncbi:hypothetical protein LUZ63_011595 [Rhynchospora breviuscula]|uniref:F-box domain-containing protein n=1 Tax=Rhynchospora breviuscula TaxID=2022672 RepID=A0A9Q0CJP1_9POAL|nr:hypothetical protein LUZ63_011595 [Rhynchospora breviuscula]